MIELDTWREAASSLAIFACGADKGRGKDDAVYREVTEGRDAGAARAHYSSCGDLGHWMLERLGVREPWVNRQSLGHYRSGVNVYDLGLGCPIAEPTPSASDWPGPETGDICEIWNEPKGKDAHVFVVIGPSYIDGKLYTANYGAGGMSPAAWPGARMSNNVMSYHDYGWYIGSRRMRRVIRLAKAVALVKAAPNLQGALLSGEVVDALMAEWKEPALPNV